MKRLMALFVAVVLMALCSASAEGLPGQVDKSSNADLYNAAMASLRNFGDPESVTEAKLMFSEIKNNYMNASAYEIYAEALMCITEGRFEQAALSLGVLGTVSGFAEQLAENGLPSCSVLLVYVKGRQLEAAEDYVAAAETYAELTVLDSLRRRIDLIQKIEELKAAASAEAELLMAAESESESNAADFAPEDNGDGAETTPQATDSSAYYPLRKNFLSFLQDKSTVRGIEFVLMDEVSTIPQDAVDVSADGQRGILMWRDEDDILYVASKGIVEAPVSCARLFAGLIQVQFIRFNQLFYTGNVQRMNEMFFNCSELTELDLSGFDTGNVEHMSSMFYNCRGLTSLDVSGFDTGNVEDMSSMFYKCSGLTSLDLSAFDIGNVEDMSGMFYSCSDLTSLDVSGFDTGNVEDMSGMFYNCKGLTSLDVSGFDTSNVEDMSSMFNYCSGLTSLDVSGFDTGDVEDMSHMFDNCQGLTSLDLSGFDTVYVADMSYMFQFCYDLTSLDVSGFAPRSNYCNYESMFFRCDRLDLSEYDLGQPSGNKSE